MTFLRLVGRGALLGLLAGLTMVAVYVSLLGFGFIAFSWLAAMIGIVSHPTDSAALMLIAPTFGGLVMVCGGLIGLLPGALLGTICGAIIGAAVAATRPWLSPGRGALLGLIITAALVLLAHLWLISRDPNPTLRAYLFFATIPGLLAIGAGGWLGWRLVIVEFSRNKVQPHERKKQSVAGSE